MICLGRIRLVMGNQLRRGKLGHLGRSEMEDRFRHHGLIRLERSGMEDRHRLGEVQLPVEVETEVRGPTRDLCLG